MVLAFYPRPSLLLAVLREFTININIDMVGFKFPNLLCILLVPSVLRSFSPLFLSSFGLIRFFFPVFFREREHSGEWGKRGEAEGERAYSGSAQHRA